MNMDSTLLIAGLLGVGLLTLCLLQKSRRMLPLPPGPPADPLIGHLRTFPTKDTEITFHEWSKKYGNVMHLRLPGQTIIVLDSHEAAVDLLEKRSGLYSCRPSVVVYELMGWFPFITFLPYGPRFRKHRRIIAPELTPSACTLVQPLQTENAHLLVNHLIKSKGDNFEHYLNRFSTAVVARFLTGHQVLSDDDEYIKISINVGHAFNDGGAVGATALDWFPIRQSSPVFVMAHFILFAVQYMPSWFPGTHYARVARRLRPLVRKLYDYPYDTVRMQMDHGTAKYSFLLKQLEAVGSCSLSPEDVDDLKGTATALYTGGVETTWSALLSFFMAMLLYPECQKRAQEEIDQVVGENRLPTLDDRDTLPYVTSIVYEILRWGRIAPLGVPHRSTQDDIYRGMFIPKGSLIFSNTTGMSLDETKYQDPKAFNPARFMPHSMGGNDEPQFWDVFGFGRRMCPGRHFGLASLWIAVATLLSTSNFTNAIDEHGKSILPVAEFISGVTSHPKPFPCVITPRSQKAEQLVAEAVQIIS